MRPRNRILATITVLLLVLFAVPPLMVSAQGQYVGFDRAAQAATAFRGSGIVHKVELDQERTGYLYEVKFTDRIEVYVDPVSGAALYSEGPGGPRGGPGGRGGGPFPGRESVKQARLEQAITAMPGRISFDQAAARASAHLGGGSPTDVELKIAIGMLVYEVTYLDGTEVFLNPATGDVYGVETPY
ncbi:MAG: hypothetical protein OHK0015_41160 [Chloroflexi bacterium OHK40]|jgi:uncharacterized membrane protein YkoI